MEIEDDVRKAGPDAAGEIEEKIEEVAEVIFDVIAEDPQEEHVAGDVQKSAMQEHTGEDRQEGGFEIAVAIQG